MCYTNRIGLDNVAFFTQSKKSIYFIGHAFQIVLLNLLQHKMSNEKQQAVFDFHEFATQVFTNQQTILKRQNIIANNMETLSKRLYSIEKSVKQLQTRSHETKIYVKRGLAECKDYLKACHDGYTQIKEAALSQLEETEDLSNTLATASVSAWC